MTQLVTGEAVVLDLRTAGAASRLLARVLDAAVQLVALTALLALLSAALPGLSDAAAAAVSLTVALLVLLGYPVTMETLSRGRTLGKLALGLRVVRDDGGAVGFRQAVVRGLVGLLVENPGITLGSAALLTSLLNERGKRLGDLLAGTVVIQERVAAGRVEAVPMPPPLARWAADLDLAGLPDDLAESARSYLARYPSLTPQSQHELGSRIAAAVSERVAPAPPPGVPAWAYLQAVLAERSRRALSAARPQSSVPSRPAPPPPPPAASHEPRTPPQVASPPPEPPPEPPPAGPFAPPA